MRLLLTLWSLAQLTFMVELKRDLVTKPVKTPKPINWNLSYYSEPFGVCKPMRKFNPVEQMRAHGVAVDMFMKCGPTLIVRYATQFNIPAFALQKAAWILCFTFNGGPAYFANDGTLNVKDDVDLRDIMTLVKNFCRALSAVNWTTKVKHKKETFVIRPEMCHTFLYSTVECGLQKVPGIRDGDVAKYTAGHYIKMLL